MVTLELNGLARFLEDGWLVTALRRTTVDGVADFSDAMLAEPPSFVSTETIVQSIAVDGLGPEQAGWGIERADIEFDYQSVVVELLGVSEPGEIVLMPSDEFDNSLCGTASNPTMQQGDYAHPPGSNQPLQYAKYKYTLQVTETLQGPVANFTVLPPISLSTAQTRQRERENWPLPTPLEEGAYGLCYRKETSPIFREQLGNRARFAVGPLATRRVVALSPSHIFPNINAEVKLVFGPDPLDELTAATASTSAQRVFGTGDMTSTEYEERTLGPRALLGSPGAKAATASTPHLRE